jgi:hypothetical protein
LGQRLISVPYCSSIRSATGTCTLGGNGGGFKIKKPDWQFDWISELKDKTKEIYKLTTVNNPTIIQGLLSIEDNQDHIFMHLIESAKFNKGKSKAYFGVPGNLVAYACKVSVDKGFDGFLAFDVKSALIFIQDGSKKKRYSRRKLLYF